MLNSINDLNREWKEKKKPTKSHDTLFSVCDQSTINKCKNRNMVDYFFNVTSSAKEKELIKIRKLEINFDICKTFNSFFIMFNRNEKV